MNPTTPGETIPKTKLPQQQLEERREYLLRLSDVLKPLSDTDQIQYEAASTLGSFFGAGRAGYAEDCGDGRRVRVSRNYTNGMAGIEGVYHYQDYGPELLQAFREGRTVVRSNIANDPLLTDAEKKAHAALELGATLNVPILKKGRLLGILFVHYKTAHPFSDNEIALIEETAERTWAAVEAARSTAALKASEEKYRSLFEKMDQGFCIIDMVFDAEGNAYDYLFIEANPVFEAQTGLKKPVGKTANELVPGLEAHWFRIYGDVALTGIPNRFVEGSEKMGRWFEVFAFRIDETRTNRVAILFTDISERKKKELALQENEALLQKQVTERTRDLADANSVLKQTNKELTHSNQKLEEFAHAASHDMKEPVRKIRFFANQLKDQLQARLSEAEMKTFSRVESAAQRLALLIDDLLTYSHMSDKPAGKEAVDLNEKIKQVLEDLELDVQQTGAMVEVGTLPKVQGYPRQLQQLFQNLISNALKYVAAGAVPHVSIQAADVQKNGKAYRCISVADKGIGFEQQYAERIFGMFTRLHGKNEYSGTGIGLSIVEKVVENHEGFIEAESTLGEGSTFKVYLPAE